MPHRVINSDFKIILTVGIILSIVSFSVCIFYAIVPAAVSLACSVILTVLYIVYTNKRYSEIEKLNDYLSRICAGIYDLNIPDNKEGELSILKNNLYKVILILNNQNDRLSNDKKYLADSLADISHQIKTPLTSAVMMTELLENETDEEKRKEFLSILSTQLNKINWLIQMLLKLSKLDAGTVEFVKNDISAESLIKKSVQPFLVMLDVKDIELKTEPNDCVFNCDINWTTEAIGNIIKNCMEHTPSGGKLEIKTDETFLYKEIIIRDSGCGIAEEDLPHVFERFYHGKNASPDSVGIGLALSKSIIDSQNGKITVESKNGEGSVFTIRFYKSAV